MTAEAPPFRAWLNQNHHLAYIYVVFAATSGDWTTAEELHAEIHRRQFGLRECLYLAEAQDA
ncbi:hypothetical protein [Streptomyces sp. NPDC087856]|uniref:hypothetical protein n=1 Tax=Streptomyces sp. NPDC087856 TaxID=3365811 RepID=UPI003816C97F